MTTPSPTKPTARKRPRRSRTRARTASARPALHLSSLDTRDLDLRPGAMCLVCPDCHTWCAILGIQRSTPIVTPHDTERAGTPDRRRCLGSNRRLVIDVTVAQWARRYSQLLEEACAARARRGTTLIKRPSAPAPAVTRMQPVPVTSPAQDELRHASVELARHRDRCTRCQPWQHGQTSDPCVQGALLHVRAINAQRAYVSANTPA